MKKQISEKVGYLFAFLSAFVFSFGGVIIKLMSWRSLTINSARNAIALTITLIFLRVIRHRLVFNKSTLIGGLAMTFTCTAFSIANKLTTAANVILLQYTSPVFVIILSWLIWKQKPKKRDIITCVTVFIGVGFFFCENLSGGGLAGNVLALASGVSYAVVFLTNKLKCGDSITSFVIGETLSMLIGLPFLVQETNFSAGAIGGAIALGFILGGGYALLSLALRVVQPVKANLIGTVEPVLNPMWVALIYGEKMTTLGIIGFIIVIASVIVYNILNLKKPEVETHTVK